MAMKDAPSAETHREVRFSPAAGGAIAFTVVAVLVFGFWPRGALDVAGRSASTLTQTATSVARQGVNSER